MKIFHSAADFYSDNKTILTIGTFDGVHIGHQAIINRINAIAKQTECESALLTFSPHPRHVLHTEDQEMRLLLSQSEKQEILEKTGLNHLIIHPFSQAFSRIKPANFVRDFLVEKLNVHTLVVGYDHHFGRNREGSIDELAHLAEVYDFRIEKIQPQVTNDETIVSSTKIRRLIEQGDITTANSFLGYSFCIRGKVVVGNGLGRKIGFPTANIMVEDKWKMVPKDGVYVVKVNLHGKQFGGMMNIGFKPTFSHQQRTLEVHIFDFNQEIYHQELRIAFLGRIREEQKFDNVDALVQQLMLDKHFAKQMLKTEKFVG